MSFIYEINACNDNNNCNIYTKSTSKPEFFFAIKDKNIIQYKNFLNYNGLIYIPIIFYKKLCSPSNELGFINLELLIEIDFYGKRDLYNVTFEPTVILFSDYNKDTHSMTLNRYFDFLRVKHCGAYLKKNTTDDKYKIFVRFLPEDIDDLSNIKEGEQIGTILLYRQINDYHLTKK